MHGPVPGEAFGPWLIHEELGRGGLATVWRATSADGTVVALKVMFPEKTTEEQVKRIEREFLSMQQADNPHVVKVLSSGTHEGYPWLALEYVEGGTIEELVATWHRNPPPDRWKAVEELLTGLCIALQHIHEQGFIHRDLKPSNVLVTADLQPKLTDFGSVKAPDAFTTNLTIAGRLVGTVAFMAPEQITEDSVTPRADLYALGALLYVLLTGRRPVEADSIAGYLAKHLMEDPRPPAEVDPEVPVRLSRICMRLLQKEPDRRFASASGVLAALETSDQPAVQLHGRDAELREAESRLRDRRAGTLGIRGREGSGRSSFAAAVLERARELGLDLVEGLPDGDTEVALLDDIDDAIAQGFGAWLRSPERRGLIVYTLLPEDPWLAPLALRLDPDVVTLGPLDRRAVVGMMRDAGLAGPTAPAVARRLHAACAGLPGPILDQLAALKLAGWLDEQADGSWRAGVTMDRIKRAPLPIPPAQREAALALLRGLTPARRGTVEALCVLGVEVGVATLLGLAPKADLTGLEELVEQRTEGLHELLRFTSAAAGQVVYEDLSAERRTDLHRRAAELLLQRHRRRLGSVAEQAAGHLIAAGDANRAYPLLVRAAEREAARRQIRQARRLTEQALELRVTAEEDLPEHLIADLHQRALTVQGEVLLARGLPSDARDVLTRALELGDSELVPEIRARLGMALVDLDRAEQGLLELQSALDTLAGDSPVRFAVMRSVADALSAQGKVEAAAETWERALDVAREEGDEGREGSCLLGLGELELATGKLLNAVRALELAEPRLRRARLIRPLAVCLVALAEVALLDGRMRVCLARSDEAQQLAEEQELNDVQARASLHRAEALLSAGQDEDTRGIVRSVIGREVVLPSLELTGSTTLHHLGLQVLGPDAVSAIRFRESAPTHPAHVLARWELYRSWALIRDGDRGAAKAHAERAESVTLQPGMAGLRLETLLALAILGDRRDMELKDLVQRVLANLAPDMRPGFVERLRRLGIFKR